MLVSNCRSSCGNETPGDQSQAEWRIQTYFDFPWDVVCRYPAENVQHLISNYARHAAENDHCGYSMNTRTLFWDRLSTAKDYDPANITDDCNADCSSSTCAIIKAVGLKLGITALSNFQTTLTTMTMRTALLTAGFQTVSKTDIQPGDILLNTASHVCIAVADSDYTVSGATCEDNSNKLRSSNVKNSSSNNFYLTGDSIGNAAIQGILVDLGYEIGRFRDARGAASGIDGDAGKESSQTNNALKLAIASGKITEKQVKSVLEVLGA